MNDEHDPLDLLLRRALQDRPAERRHPRAATDAIQRAKELAHFSHSQRADRYVTVVAYAIVAALAIRGYTLIPSDASLPDASEMTDPQSLLSVGLICLVVACTLLGLWAAMESDPPGRALLASDRGLGKGEPR